MEIDKYRFLAYLLSTERNVQRSGTMKKPTVLLLLGLLVLGTLAISRCEAGCRGRRCSAPPRNERTGRPVEISWEKTKQFWAEQSQEYPTAVAGIVGGIVTLAGVSVVLISGGLTKNNTSANEYPFQEGKWLKDE